jgi:cell cycle checkpoint control protein RAD9A
MHQASVSFAESLSLSLDFRFTDPAAPLFIDVEDENSDSLFVISTTQVPGADRQPRLQTPSTNSNNKKRDRDESVPINTRVKKPTKVVQKPDPATVARSEQSRVPGSMPPPSLIPHPPSTHSPLSSQHHQPADEPLFLPNSQLSVAELGFEGMDADDFVAMMDRDDGEEVGYGASQTAADTGDECRDFGDESEIAPTQSGVHSDSKVYQYPMRLRGH